MENTNIIQSNFIIANRNIINKLINNITHANKKSDKNNTKKIILFRKNISKILTTFIEY